MQVLILNESSKKALVRSRRVLSKFLPQLGSTTWAGSLSQEGLEDLRQELKAAGVSKNTAISCLQFEGRGRLTPQWVLGSRAPFDDSGRFAFRQTQARALTQAPVERSAREKLNQALLRLAGLAHDTGKASKAFADKLRRGTGAEALRHELLSFLVLAESLNSPGVSDVAWLEQVRTNPRSLVACVDSTRLLPPTSPLLGRVLAALASAQRQRDAGQEESVEVVQPLMLASEIEELLKTAPALGTLLWLVLTHHRLPDSDRTAQAWWAGQHIHLPGEFADFVIADVETCLQVAAGAVPWQDEAWLKAVSSAAESALFALNELQLSQEASGSTPGEAALLALQNAHYLRPALILADHLGSQRAPKSFRKSDKHAKEHVFANTLGSDWYGDTLSQHELAVARLTRQVLRLYDTAWPTTQLPSHSLSVVRPLKAPFEWQMHLEDACAQARDAGPAFVSIIAETGAGKTLAGLRAANALCGGKLRLTLALGLRSLTQQSADAMLEDALLPAKDLVVAVGDPQTLGLAEQFKEQEAQRFGSESAEGVDADASVRAPAPADLSWLNGFCTEKEAPLLWGQKTLAMLAAPVLACTTDHLVSSATLLRGGDAKMYLRLVSSDLLLDEIDAYSARDLQSIGKLVLLSGLHGRNVILMSATLSPEVRNGLYAAWTQGLAVRAELKGKSMPHACVLSSNTVASRVLSSAGEPLADSAWTSYAAEVAQAYTASNAVAPRRRLREVALNLEGTKTGAFEQVTEAACDLHRVHNTVDPETGVRVSTGFVRLNTAKNAWALAKHLSEREPGDVDVRFVAYHSKYPRTYLGVLDATLQQLTNRKRPQEFLQTPALRKALCETTKKDLLVLVCTTTLIETGRDFDFDWCVLEPRSVRGEIQGTGRVWRHRRELVAQEPNVVMLSHPLKALEPPEDLSKESVWSRPGVEDELPNLRVTMGVPAVLAGMPAPGASALGVATAPVKPAALRRRTATTAATGTTYVRNAREALPLASWEQAIHAAPCLLPSTDYARDRIGYLEHRVQELHLGGPSRWDRQDGVLPPSLALYRNSLASLNRVHAVETPFRGRKEEPLVFIPQAGEVLYFDELAARARKGASRRAAAGADLVEVPAKTALLPDLEAAAQTLFTGTDHHIDGCTLRCALHLGADKKLQWNPLLGFREGA